MISTSLKGINERSALIRLTALWAMNEAALGGFLHLFRTPFSGLILASIAVILISLIAYVSTHPSREIMKALMIVLIIKLTLSPHSPITAYIAVAFQGIVGALLFSFLPFRIAALLLGVLGLIESVFQKLLTLTLLFGMPLWEAVDAFVLHVGKLVGMGPGTDSNGSMWVISFYVGLYALTGLLVGWKIGGLPDKLNKMMQRLTVPDLSDIDETLSSSKRRKSFWQSKKFKFFVGVILFLVLIYFLVPEASVYLKPVYLFARVAIILLLWYFIVSPILMKALQKFLNKKESTYSEDVKKALSLIPSFKALMQKAWEGAQELKGIKRIKQFLLTGLSYCLLYNK